MRSRTVIPAFAAAVALGAALAFAQGGFKLLSERLSGLDEVPVISTTGHGEFHARISDDDSTIAYELSYVDMEGSVTQAHIHFGPPNNTGGISVWLCSNLASPPTPPGVQPCPSTAGTISGVITAADVVGPTPQGIEPGALGELIAAIRDGKTYVNVHSTKWPGGEIRAQIEHDHRGRP